VWGDKSYRIIIQEDIKVIYLMDISEYSQIKKRYQDEKFVLGNIFVDNYDEIVQGMTDRNISSINTFITTQLSNWAKQHRIYLKRVSEDRFIVFMHRKSLERMEKENFSILDQIREKTSKQNIPLTLSIGVAYTEADKEDENLEELKKYIDATYSQHYAQTKLQATEIIVDAGHGEGFFIGDIIKYALRYGKKEGNNKKDLLKIIHYSIIQLYVHDDEQLDQQPRS
jgi:GGDEF domain-containing protein